MAIWRRIPITIRAAIITVVGGGVFVLIGSTVTPFVDHWLESTAVVSTQIANPTTTLAPTPISSTTLSISATPITAVPETPTMSPDYIVSRGLNGNCFDAQYWTPKNAIALSTDDKNCWILDEWGILPEAGGFKVFINPAKSVASHWVSTAIPENARISFTINISNFQTVDDVYGSLVFGFGKASEDFLRGDFLIYRVIQAQSRIYTYFGDPLSHQITPIPHIEEYPKDVDQKVILVINKLSLEIYLDGERVVDPRSLSTNERQLFWMGFRLPQNGSLNATISNFEINP